MENLWQSGREATLQVNSLAGKATVSLKVELGQAQPLQPHHQYKREPGPSRLRRSRRRADARKSADQAATAGNTTEEVDAATHDENLDVTTAGKEVAENAAENESSDNFGNEDSFKEGNANIPQLDGEPEEGLQENEGKEAFECLQCKLVFIPMSHMHGNPIFDYESCRKHLGVSKCKNCAMALIGLDRTRAHMEICLEPA